MRLQHARASLELHELSGRSGPGLLLLHALYGSAADWIDIAAAWPGAVYALDFSGHGRSDWLLAGGYTPELLAADADSALARIGPATVAGAGIGAYVALLVAGARPNVVPAALLLPGAGCAGGGALPDFANPRERFTEFPRNGHGCGSYDPMVAVLDQDVRPPEYVAPFARAARALLLAEDGAAPPPWWQTVRTNVNAEVVVPDVKAALTQMYARIIAPSIKTQDSDMVS